MGYEYDRIDGERVEANAAQALQRLKAAFRQRFGLDLIVSDGVRTRAEQAYLYDGWINRRPGFNLAAAPGYSNHEETGPRGPRAVDLRDSGGDPGVTRFGTERGNWLAANAPSFGFTQAGATFNPREAWHYEWTGAVGGRPGGSSGSGGGESWHTAASVIDIQNLGKRLGFPGATDGIDGPETRGWVEAFQRDHGLDPDGRVGPQTWAKMNEVANGLSAANDKVKREQAFLNAYRGETLDIDGNKGPATTEAYKRYQKFLKKHYGYGGEIDGDWGQGTQDAHARYYEERDQVREVTKQRQAFLNAARGETLTVDGVEGDGTENAYKRYQEFLRAYGYNGEIDGNWGGGTQDAHARYYAARESGQPVPETPKPNPQPQPSNGAAFRITPLSPLAKEAWDTPRGRDDRTKAANGRIEINGIAVHHAGATGSQLSYLKGSGEGSVYNAYIDSAGNIYEMTAPGKRSVATATQNNWTYSICLENSGGDSAGWPVTDAALASLENQIAWLASQKGKTVAGVYMNVDINAQSVKGHRDWPGNSTSCPGPYVYPRLDKIRANAKAKLDQKPVDTKPETPSTGGDKVAVDREWLQKLIRDSQGYLS